MANKQLSILLLAKDMASKTIGKVSKEVSGLGRAGATAGRGLQNLATNLGRLGVVAAAGIGLAVKGGLQDLATLESAVSSVEGAITQLGLTGRVTGGQVAAWANEIEASTEAAFDDKAITNATATLIRYGKVTDANLRPAMVVMTDLAAKTGDVDSAASLLAKALADPEKAAGKLSKSGVVLTKVQQAEIKALVKAGKTTEAQTYLLDELAKATTGAARASKGPYQDALNILADTAEDARKALAEGFLPVITKVANLLSTNLAKPEVMAGIREFGQGLAKGLDNLIEIARGLPWGTIGDSLKLAGSGAKAVLDVFVAMPPWVQTAVLTGWGLNKLTGGALGSIVGQLASGLVKGVLGIQAGVVNVTGGVVNAPGTGVLPPAGPSLGPVATGVAVGTGLIAGQVAGEVIRNAVGIPSTVQGTVAAITKKPTNTPTKVISSGMSPDERQAANDAKAGFNRVYDKLEQSRAATVLNLQQVQANIKGLLAPLQQAFGARDTLTNVYVTVNATSTAKDIQRSVIVSKRHGPLIDSGAY